MSESQRATGRTFRTVMKAITAASEGKQVYVIFHSESLCSMCLRTIIKIIECWSSHMIRGVKSNCKTIEIDGGGKISLMSLKEFEILETRGKFSLNKTVLFDHYQGERL